MSGAIAHIVRQPMAGKVRTRRHLEDRLIARFPAGLALLGRAVLRLPTRSRLRQAIVRHGVQVMLAAHNRRDMEVTFSLLHDDCESTFPAQMVGLGSVVGTPGRRERIQFHRRFFDEWGDLRYDPEELVDAGDRLLVIGRMKGTGLSSGAVFDNEWALLAAFEGGQIVSERVFLDHREAREAAELSE